MKILPVASYADYRCIIKGKKLVNNGFLPDDIKKYILQNRLFYSQSGNHLFLLYDEVNYYQLICEGIEDNEKPDLTDFEASKPIVSHIVDNSKSNLIIGLKKTLQASGFRLRCTIHEYVREHLTDLQASCSKEFTLSSEIMSHSECQKILSLWQNNLPVYEVSYMLPEDIQQLCDKKQIICLTDFSTGKLAGACFYDVLLGTTTIHHIVVEPGFRGKGCAEILLTAWLEQAKQFGAKTARSWIEDENLSSQKCFSKIGFSKTSNLSYQYIKL